MFEEPLPEFDPALDLDRLFRLLSKRRRRWILACLDRHRSMTLADLAEEIAVRERDLTIDEIPPEAVKEIYMELYHRHVPPLDDADLVRYAQERDTVAISDRGADVGAWLRNELSAATPENLVQVDD